MNKDLIPPKSIEENFIDWESDAFGFGYGTGEPHTLQALKDFFAVTDPGKSTNGRTYSYEKLELHLGPKLAWLMINILCRVGVIEYGTSPRYAWLSPEGVALYEFTCGKSTEDLAVLCNSRTADTAVLCDPQACNCGPRGYVRGRKCPNPFWPGHH